MTDDTPIKDIEDDIEVRRKRLTYRANYRGFKEADMILGGFAKAHGHELSEAELTTFEYLLGAKDHDIYAWINGSLPVPESFDTPLFARICAFDPKVI